MGCCKFVTAILVPQAAESLKRKSQAPKHFKTWQAVAAWLHLSVEPGVMIHHSLVEDDMPGLSTIYCPILDFQAHPGNAWKLQLNMRSFAKENFGKPCKKQILLNVDRNDIPGPSFRSPKTCF